jgi:ubiquinone/menaquinone biosynthesis C-methylase UbiE
MTSPPVCDYEGSDYQSSFWEQGGREYEDRAEAIALEHLLPASGRLMLELGAGAGRNTPRYAGYERIVLLDYSRTQLEQARARLGDSPRFIYVAADIYRLPFVAGLFDGATMIRALHHMQDAPRALAQVRRTLQPEAIFVLEYANKRNLKAILRYWLGRQSWSPFTPEPVEFAALNFDFHPKAIRKWLADLGFRVEATRTVSHFRAGPLKRHVPARWLATLDGLFQSTGAFFQLTPSVFVRARVSGQDGVPPVAEDEVSWFQCPECGHHPLSGDGHLEGDRHLHCPNCGRTWGYSEGIYDFKQPLA